MSLNFRRLSMPELCSEFNINGSVEALQFNTHPAIVWEDGNGGDTCPGCTAVVFDGPVTLPALAYHKGKSFAEFDCNCILVNGDLTIEGTMDLTMSDWGVPAYVFVLGDLVVENLFICEQCELTVTGSLTVKNVLLGSQCGSARLVVGGDLDARRTYLSYFYCTVSGRIVHPLLIWGDRDHIDTPASNDVNVWELADWHVLDFDGVDKTARDDPRFQQHIVFNDHMLQFVPYHDSYDDKLIYWTRQGIDVFRDDVFAEQEAKRKAG